MANLVKSVTYMLISLSLFISGLAVAGTYHDPDASCADVFRFHEQKLSDQDESELIERAKDRQRKFLETRTKSPILQRLTMGLLGWRIQKNLSKNDHDGHPWAFMKAGFPQKVRLMAKLGHGDEVTKETLDEAVTTTVRYESYHGDILAENYHQELFLARLRLMMEALEAAKSNPHEEIRLWLPVKYTVKRKSKEEKFGMDSEVEIIYTDEPFQSAHVLKREIDSLIESEKLRLRDAKNGMAEFQNGRHEEQVHRWWMLRIYHHNFAKFPAGNAANYKEGNEDQFRARRDLKTDVRRLLFASTLNTDEIDDNTLPQLKFELLPPLSAFIKYSFRLWLNEVKHTSQKDLEYSDSGDEANNELWNVDRFSLNVDGTRTRTSRSIINATFWVVGLPLAAVLAWDPIFERGMEYKDKYVFEDAYHQRVSEITNQAQYILTRDAFLVERHGTDWRQKKDVPKVQEDLKSFREKRQQFLANLVKNNLSLENVNEAYKNFERNAIIAQTIMLILLESDPKDVPAKIQKIKESNPPEYGAAIDRAVLYAGDTFHRQRQRGADLLQTVMEIHTDLTYNILP